MGRLTILVFTLGVLSAFAATTPPSRTSIFTLGDDAFRVRFQPESAIKALETYRAIYHEHQNDPQAGWRVAMACQYVGQRLVSSSDEKQTLFAEGRDAGLAALELDETCGPCHFWTAVNMALFGQTVGPLKTLFTLKSIRRHLIRSIELDPDYAFGGAYRILGMIAWKLPGILGGSDSEAREDLQKAIESSPKEPMNYWFLSQLLWDAFGDHESALRIAKTGISFPEPSEEWIEAKESWNELKDFVKNHEPKTEAVAALSP